MARTLAACVLPALAVSVAWLRVEDPRTTGTVLAVAVLALAPALARRARMRALAAVAATAGAVWVAFRAGAWELIPFRDERVLGPVSDSVRRGVEDFYGVLLPFEPQRNPEMHALVLCAVFGFILAIVLLVAARRPLAAAAVTVVAVGWPATLVDGGKAGLGALALAAALSIPVVLRARSAPSLVAGAATAGLVVVVAVWASPATAVAREAALDWQAWDLRPPEAEASSVRFAWEADYDGIRFPPTKTVVLTVEGPESAHYWRASTLDLFTSDRWFEDLFWLARVEGVADAIPLDRLTPRRAARRESWLEQRIEVKALVDDHLTAAGTPVALDTRQIGNAFLLSGGVLRVRDPLNRGRRYRVWSYVPDPAPAELAAARPRYPAAAARYLEVDGRAFPAFRSAGREAVAQRFFRSTYGNFGRYRPLYASARRVAGSAATSYQAVLSLESWFRQRGGFTYDEQPPTAAGPPLVAFVRDTKAGYCQHYAGAMTVMLRMLGIPARVAVGFTSGTRDDGKWVVTDRDAHAWVEAWFAGVGWVPFDPTPGRGTFGATYSFASDSLEAVGALRRGELSPRRFGDDVRRGDSPSVGSSDGGSGAPSLFLLALAFGGLWVVVVGGAKTVRRRARFLTRDPRRVATSSRQELEAFLRDQGISLVPGTTLEALRRTVGVELRLDVRAFTIAVARARFGPLGEAARDPLAPRRELKSLLRAIRFELSGWARFRGFVSPRSLVGGGSR